MNKFKGAIFDLDGTVLDSMKVWQRVDEKFFLSRNMQVPDGYIQAISPLGTYNAAVYTKEKYGIKESVEEIMAEWHDSGKDEYSKHVVLKPFAKQYINFLKENGTRLAVATASDPEMFEECLKKNGIFDAFDFFTTVNEAGRGKGFPDIYLATAGKFGINPEECMVFEDILTGITSAKSVGFYCVGVYDESSKKDSQKIKAVADRFIYNFEEML